MKEWIKDFEDCQKIIEDIIKENPLFIYSEILTIANKISIEIKDKLQINDVEAIITKYLLYYYKCVGINEVKQGLFVLKRAIASDMVNIKYFNYKKEVEIKLGLREPDKHPFKDVKFIGRKLLGD